MSEPRTGHRSPPTSCAPSPRVLDEIIPPSADGRLPGAGFLAGGERFAAVVR